MVVTSIVYSSNLGLFEEILKEMRGIKRDIQQIFRELGAIRLQIAANQEPSVPSKFPIPLRTLSDLDCLLKMIGSHENYEIMVYIYTTHSHLHLQVDYLSKRGGDSIVQATRNIMRTLVADEITPSINWKEGDSRGIGSTSLPSIVFW